MERAFVPLEGAEISHRSPVPRQTARSVNSPWRRLRSGRPICAATLQRPHEPRAEPARGRTMCAGTLHRKRGEHGQRIDQPEGVTVEEMTVGYRRTWSRLTNRKDCTKSKVDLTLQSKAGARGNRGDGARKLLRLPLGSTVARAATLGGYMTCLGLRRDSMTQHLRRTRVTTARFLYFNLLHREVSVWTMARNGRLRAGAMSPGCAGQDRDMVLQMTK
jgi:hypothetical protein